MASFPASVASFSTKIDIYDIVFADHVNKIQDEVIAVETVLGTNVNTSPGANPGTAFVSSASSFSSVAARLANIENGVVADSHTQYPKIDGGSTIVSNANVVGLVIQAKASQTADIFQVKTSNGTVVFSVSASGSVSIGGLSVASLTDYESLKAALYLGGELS